MWFEFQWLLPRRTSARLGDLVELFVAGWGTGGSDCAGQSVDSDQLVRYGVVWGLPSVVLYRELPIVWAPSVGWQGPPSVVQYRIGWGCWGRLRRFGILLPVAARLEDGVERVVAVGRWVVVCGARGLALAGLVLGVGAGGGVGC